MTLVRFAIDDRAFLLDALPGAEAAAIIRSLLSSMQDLDEAGHVVCFDPDLIVQPIWGGLSFWELFHNPDVPLTMDDYEVAVAQFGIAARWDETGYPQPVDLDVSIGGGPVEVSGPIAWAHARALLGLDGAACLSSSANRTMEGNVVTVGAMEREVWLVETDRQTQSFFRDLLKKHAQTPGDIERLSSDAFPDLYFARKCFDGIKSMSKPVGQLAPAIVHHLGALSDHGRVIFGGLRQEVEGRFGSRGVNISDENGNTKQNANARRQRTISWNGFQHICWWHMKLEPDRDRIYLDPAPLANGGKILVGIFCRHLDT